VAASPEFAPTLAEDLTALEHDITAAEFARSDSLLAALPRSR
jgi:hypothetical protein